MALQVSLPISREGSFSQLLLVFILLVLVILTGVRFCLIIEYFFFFCNQVVSVKGLKVDKRKSEWASLPGPVVIESSI